MKRLKIAEIVEAIHWINDQHGQRCRSGMSERREALRNELRRRRAWVALESTDRSFDTNQRGNDNA